MVLEAAQQEKTSPEPSWKMGLLPLLWLVPFTFYLILLILIIGFIGT
jgi:hypothetical protein